MKEYKYKINGNIYKVAVGDIDDNIAQVEVNGVPYKVELERAKAAAVKSVAPRPAAAPRTASGEKVISKPAAAGPGAAVTAPLPGVVLSIPWLSYTSDASVASSVCVCASVWWVS